MVQFENEYVKIETLNNSKILKIVWIGFVPGDAYRAALEKSLEIAKKFKITNWLTDARTMKVVKLENQDWAMKDWMPRVVNAGCYKKQAVVLPQDLFGKASADRMISMVGNQEVAFSNFGTEESAIDWLSGVTV
jgi:hypothetical protein